MAAVLEAAPGRLRRLPMMSMLVLLQLLLLLLRLLLVLLLPPWLRQRQLAVSWFGRSTGARNGVSGRRATGAPRQAS